MTLPVHMHVGGAEPMVQKLHIDLAWHWRVPAQNPLHFLIILALAFEKALI